MNDSDGFFRRADDQPPELGSFIRQLIYIAGADPDFVLMHCREDIGKLKAAGSIAFGAFLYNSTVFSAVAIHLVGQANLGLFIGGAALAGYMLAIDSYLFFRCGHLVLGFEQLAQTGLEVAVPNKIRKMVRRSLAIRIGLSAALGLIAGVMVSLVIYAQDIRARIELNNIHDTASVSHQLVDQADGEIKRGTDVVTATTTTVALLNKQINARLARGGTNSPQVQALEARRTAEETKLAAQKSELARLTSGRNERLRAGLDGDPTVVKASTGVLAQLSALEQIAADSWQIGAAVFLIELIAMGLDLAPVLAKMNWLPTQYSVLMARRYLERMQQTVDDMVPPPPPGGDSKSPTPAPVNDNDPFGGGSVANDNVAPEPKRKRGRPPKQPVIMTNGSGQHLPKDTG